jgi:hypothetical protein
MWGSSAVRVVVASWVREPRSRSPSREATSAVILLHLSTRNISCVTTSDGVAAVGGLLELVVEGGDPGEKIGECGSCWRSDCSAGGAS